MIRRVFIGIYRKPVQTCIMFLLFVSICTLIVSSLLLYDSAQATRKDIVRQLGSTISIAPNISNQKNSIIENSQLTSLSQDIINSILKIPHVLAYEATTGEVRGPLIPLNFRNVKIFTGIDPSTQKDVYAQSEDSKDFVYMEGSTAIPYWDQFRKHYSKIIAGNYPSEQNRGALISEELALANCLAVGDTIQVQYARNDGSKFNDAIEIPVVGVFETSLKFVVGEGNSRGEGIFQYSPYNNIFMDYQTACNVSSYDGYISNCIFFLDSPDNIDYVLTNVKKLNIDWEQYALLNNTTLFFRQYTDPVNSLIDKATNAIYFTAIGGVILFLIVASFWNKNFLYDMGILISIGEKRINIILQKFIECMTLSFFSFLPSLALGYSIIKILAAPFSNALAANDPSITSVAWSTGEFDIVQTLIINMGDNTVFYVLLFNIALSIIYTMMSIVLMINNHVRQVFTNAE